ncbi:hypothetical protein AK812_SmicGene5824 [Symbiodinium microadriaticum]|uniref:Uncharacterized protein n=1 Tax=Symbiodinium microadriaticum TaxID=2951 RepID=A0A1Q9ESR3_SYMMI|nr:hypothetical protein AK812_SmicGene5824 [Symbiodinium microadriaticum]
MGVLGLWSVDRLRGYNVTGKFASKYVLLKRISPEGDIAVLTGDWYKDGFGIDKPWSYVPPDQVITYHDGIPEPAEEPASNATTDLTEVLVRVVMRLSRRPGHVKEADICLTQALTMHFCGSAFHKQMIMPMIIPPRVITYHDGIPEPAEEPASNATTDLTEVLVRVVMTCQRSRHLLNTGADNAFLWECIPQTDLVASAAALSRGEAILATSNGDVIASADMVRL